MTYFKLLSIWVLQSGPPVGLRGPEKGPKQFWGPNSITRLVTYQTLHFGTESNNLTKKLN